MYPSRPRVTITHKPSGISASCDQRRTNRENHDKAMSLLRSRLWAAQQFSIPESDINVETFCPGANDQEGSGDETR